MNDLIAQEKIREFIIENFLDGDDKNFKPGDSYFSSSKIKFDGFLELISFLEERFGILFKDDELIPADFDTLNKIVENIQIKTLGEKN